MRLRIVTGILFGLAVMGFSPSVSAETIVSPSINTDELWTASSSPYVLNNDTTLAAGATLTIEPGVVVKLQNGVDFIILGNLLANGTEEEKIYFTSYHDDTVGGDTNNNGGATVPQARDWRTIQFNSGSVGQLRNAIIRYAGYFTSTKRSLPALYNNGGSLDIENSVISNNRIYGIGQVSGSLEIRNSEIKNQDYGVVVTSGECIIYDTEFSSNDIIGLYSTGDGNLEIKNNAFVNNGIAVDVSLALERDFVHGGNTSSGSGLNGVVVRGPVSAEVTLSSGDMPYVVSSSGGLSAVGAITISRNGNLKVSATGNLTLDPGVVMKFSSGGRVEVEGSLNSLGEEDNLVYLTSIKDDEVGGDTNDDGSATVPSSSNWNRIQFNSGSQGNFNYSVVRYSGQRTVSTDTIQSGVYNNGGNVTVTNSEIFQNNQNGIRNDAGAVTINDSSISGHSVYGVYNRATNPLDATNNYWGDSSGPFHGSLNPTGQGDGVSNNVLFDPWLGAYPPEEPPEPPEIDPLILQYEPVLYFHPDEDYYPMNVEAFVEGSGLWDSSFIDEVIIPRGDNNGLDLNYLANGTDTENWYINFSSDEAGEFNLEAAKTRYDELVQSSKAVPTYYAYKMEDSYTDDFGNVHEFIVLQYWYFYAMNNWGKYQISGNNHEGDWESVFIFLDKNTEEPKYIAYSSHHNDGDPSSNLFQFDSVRRKWNEILIDNNKPVSFVSAGSHANYSDNGNNGVRFAGRGDDLTSSDGVHFQEGDWLKRISLLLNTENWLTEYEGLFGVKNLGLGTSGIEGPLFNDVGGIVRFEEPVEWAGLDKVNDTTIQVSGRVFDLDSQGILLEFSEALKVGTKLTTSLYDEFISYGSNLKDINMLPHFWDFESDLENGTFNAKVTFEYNQAELGDLNIIENDLTVYYFNEATNIWEAQPSFLDTTTNTISFVTNHFSRYALGSPKWETLTSGFELKKRWGKYDPKTGIREAGVGLKGDVSGRVRLLITDITEEGVYLVNNTGTTTNGIPFIDVILEAKKPFDAKLMFSIPEKELDSSSNNEKQVPGSLNFDYQFQVQKSI